MSKPRLAAAGIAAAAELVADARTHAGNPAVVPSGRTSHFKVLLRASARRLLSQISADHSQLVGPVGGKQRNETKPIAYRRSFQESAHGRFYPQPLATATTLQYAEMCPNVQELRRHEAPGPPRQVSSGPCRSFFWVSEGIVLFLGLISVL